MRTARSTVRVLAATLSLVVCASGVRAMGGQDCAPDDLRPVDAWLAKHPWVDGTPSPDRLVASACKPSSRDKGITIVAAAYATDDEYGKNVAVALVDTEGHQVRAAFKGVIAEDASLRVMQGSLKIDTAPYDLAPGVRAFGVDLSSGMSGPRCASASFGPNRTLFIRQGSSLRPVLSGLMLSLERVVNDKSACDENAELEMTRTSIAIGTQAPHGLADIIITDTIDGRSNRRSHTLMRFDGTAYRAPGRESLVPTIAPAPTR